jgi:hypothetical protein
LFCFIHYIFSQHLIYSPLLSLSCHISLSSSIPRPPLSHAPPPFSVGLKQGNPGQALNIRV